jgi:hypothetical protein
VAAQDHQRRPVLGGQALVQSALEGVEVLGRLAELDHVPVVPLEAAGDVVGVGELGGAVDGDVVVVVDVHESSEAEVPGQRRSLVAHALLEVSVGADGEHVVVGDVAAEPLAQVALDDGHADAVGEALAERPGGHLDARRVPVLGVARRPRPVLAELLQVVELESVAREVEHGVQQHRRMPGRQHEAIAVGPVRLGGVVAHDARVEDVCERRQGHGRARMTRVRLLDRVHGEAADHVDGTALERLGGCDPRWRCLGRHWPQVTWHLPACGPPSRTVPGSP